MLKKEAKNVVSYYKRKKKSLLRALECQRHTGKYLIEEELHY